MAGSSVKISIRTGGDVVEFDIEKDKTVKFLRENGHVVGLTYLNGKPLTEEGEATTPLQAGDKVRSVPTGQRLG